MKILFNKIAAFFMCLYMLIFGIAPKAIERTPVFSDTHHSEHQKQKFDEGTADMKDYDIVVSPDGNDNNNGTIESPLKTPAAAKELAKKSNAVPLTVWFKEGEYTISDPLIFNASDKQNVTYRSFPNEEVKFTGSKPVASWNETKVNGVRAFVTDFYGEINSLFKDNKMLSRPVYPKNGELVVKNVNKKDRCTNTDGAFVPIAAFYAGADDLQNFKNVQDIDVRVLHYWCDELLPVAKLDAQNGRIEVQKPSSMTIKADDRFIFENVFEALSQPNEWYLDKSESKLYYIPEKDETPENLVLYAPVTEKLINISNTAEINFSGIDFGFTDWDIVRKNKTDAEVYPDHYLHENLKYLPTHSQACFDVPAAIEITDSESIDFINCKFRCTGYSALCFGQRTKNCTVQSCLFDTIGANAINIMGKNDVENENNQTSHITVTDCHIKSYGRIFNNAIGVFSTHANNCEISHNEIHDGLYTAISVGWIWGYADSVSKENRITDNLIYDIGQGWLSDMGGIYTLGIQNGTVISGNTIHDVGCYGGDSGYGGWGIYLDEGSSYILVEKNLAYNCSSEGFHQHYGKENIIRNNIFALNKEGQLKVTKKEKHNSLTLSNNIFLGDNSLMYYSTKGMSGAFKDDSNLYWDIQRGSNVISNDYGKRNEKSPAAMMLKGFYNNGLFGDPLFKDPKNADFTLAENSPAFDTGFEEFNWRAAGTLTDFS